LAKSLWLKWIEPKSNNKHQQMNGTYKKPTDKLSEYVQGLLVIENYHVTVPFCLPLFANGTPTLLFHSALGQIKKNSGYLTLFGQTIVPDILQIDSDFTLVAYDGSAQIIVAFCHYDCRIHTA